MTDKNAKNENSKLRIMTFFPPFIILVAFLVLSLVDQETFLGVINNINNWIHKNLGWAASILALAICNRRRCCHVFQIWRCTNRW